MADLEKDLLGFTDDNDEALKSKSGGKFGLNQNVKVENFDVITSDDGTEFIELDLKIGDKVYSRRYYNLGDKLKYKGREYPAGTEEYMIVAKRRAKDFTGTMTHIFKALGVPVENIKEAVKDGARNFVEYFKKLKTVLPENYKDIPVDVFLQWQYRIKEGQDTTFLELPYGMADGYWISRHVEPVGEWKEEITSEYIRYIDDAGNEHPLKKDKSFVNSPKAKRQERKQVSLGESPAEDLWG